MTRPALAHDWQALATAARQMLAQRIERDPPYVEAGKMTAEIAADRLRIAQALVAQWDSIVAHEPPYDPQDAWIATGGREGAYPHELREDLRAAAKRARTLADKHGEDAGAAAFADAVEALAWHERPRDHISHVRDAAHINYAFRQSAAGPAVKAAA
ncbi:hypothetical protein [Sphingomonas sp. Leaf4]|uniref:hypothetical protein n=1 Tax=Sphingomonas sp. Leaf4 TaxID=2876553 RepID=UPI001E65C95E|nr:hypothetical protein [Sphingomonas sp. Leaf4]